MDIKEPSSYNYRTSLSHFQGQLLAFSRALPALKTHTTINFAIVPSSTKDKSPVALKAILDHININIGNRFTYNADFLVRQYDVPTAHAGGERSEKIHLDSILVNTTLDSDTPIILLDDVYTTGCTIKACESLLRGAGATNIYKLVLGKTV